MYSISETHGVRVMTLEPEQPRLGSEADALEILGQAFGEHADVVVVPVEHVDERFFTLSTRIAGDVVRKFAGYRVRLAVVGDLGPRLESDSFRAFVHEINKGTDIWFPADHAALAERLREAKETLGRSR
jgi:hypothetical protein